MKVVHVAAECAPFAKVGGLGDVLYGLSNNLMQLVDQVEVILPKYKIIKLDSMKKKGGVDVFFDGKFQKISIVQSMMTGGVILTFIEAPYFFNRDEIYGYEDDITRFTFFCVAVIAYLKTKETPPDIVHLHDWQTAIIPSLIKTKREMSSKTILTIHNLAYQGVCQKIDFEKIGLTTHGFIHEASLNLLNGGIVYADQLTTVSPTYAKEILTKKHGEGLQNLLNQHREKLVGILNGIDYDYWNPMTDCHLPFHYGRSNLNNKKKNKLYLQKMLALNAEKKAPLVSTIARLVPQKGPELIKEAFVYTLKMGGQFVLLGSTADPEWGRLFSDLKDQFANCPDVHFELSYNEPLSHLVYAASDFFVVPSHFEPCGLTQMIAMHYGAVPIVRETGGLIDTVFNEKNGFTFQIPTGEALTTTLKKAFKTFEENEKLKQMIAFGMEKDVSWNHPAKQYLDLYKGVLSLR
ncbi:MAG: glycogen synthase [Chlamydiia bacterium]|nr:glycogen synthase [Chlamydiia bacterium]